ncbi:MAG TPA: DMT family transporter [Candidatus Ignatzschineria merdigallinarum]|uniref:DMT family transporter n=1 Tax=Candidatus Ignatzschineria merdigallinarum TaxID=2838621 RepID=A0A9D1TT31_9GAMM|nr:DMT family transporter [Candidatus Ignatzschineria merdigallinarum]
MPLFIVALLTALTPIMWGSTYIVTTELLPSGYPFLAALLRVLPAGLLLILWTRKFPKGNDWFKVMILGMLNIGIFQVMLFVAAYRLPGGLAAILGAIQPIIVLVLMASIAKMRIPNAAWIAAIVGVIGMVAMLYSPNMQIDFIGVSAALLGALSMALGTFLSRYWRVDLPLTAFTGWQLFFGGLLILPVFLGFESWPEMTMKNILGYSYLCLFGALLAYLLWFQGIKRLSPAVVSSIGLLSPVTAFFLGWIFLGERLTLISMLGFVMILGSIYAIQKALRPKA